ncbi:hypothetical protein D0T84_10940 [Dysgonomonas sp. 521]|uniref:hypothetical protein n=1 Tax=Dysgonomonas sp. 521 TaxID=2302932 RepID=UPI0013D03A7D|nr:hypothetical protein [Dysgonomonas sp. 521]NDV95427.1 hypothetical protein [Dysgonomonas sp. 521]
MAWKDIIYLHKYTANEIEQLSEKTSAEISIDISGYIGFSEEQLHALNRILLKQDYTIALQYGVNYLEKKEGLIYNLDILKYIPNVKNLGILNQEYKEAIESFDFLTNTPLLTYFYTLGLFKKSISFEPLRQLKYLKKLKLDLGLNKKQQEVINDIITSLEFLYVPEFDLAKTPLCPALKFFSIDKKLISSELLPQLFPNLQSLYLKKIKNCEDFTFISDMINLRRLTLHWIFQFDTIPNLSKLSELEILEIVGSPNLQYGLEYIYDLKKLRGLMLTELQFPVASSFTPLTKLRKLESVYINFRKNNKETSIIEKFVEDNNWAYMQPGLAGVTI